MPLVDAPGAAKRLADAVLSDLELDSGDAISSGQDVSAHPPAAPSAPGRAGPFAENGAALGRPFANPAAARPPAGRRLWVVALVVLSLAVALLVFFPGAR